MASLGGLQGLIIAMKSLPVSFQNEIQCVDIFSLPLNHLFPHPVSYFVEILLKICNLNFPISDNTKTTVPRSPFSNDRRLRWTI